MLSGINKLLNKLDDCNNPNGMIDPALMNAVMSSFAANAAGLADCTSDRLGKTTNTTIIYPRSSRMP
jgi:hypothetical protein